MKVKLAALACKNVPKRSESKRSARRPCMAGVATVEADQGVDEGGRERGNERRGRHDEREGRRAGMRTVGRRA